MAEVRIERLGKAFGPVNPPIALVFSIGWRRGSVRG
jgi:hypothetical protein